MTVVRGEKRGVRERTMRKGARKEGWENQCEECVLEPKGSSVFIRLIVPLPGHQQNENASPNHI